MPEEMLITFDSNVWRRVVSPDQFPNDPHQAFYRKIHYFLHSDQLKGRLSETIFTLEAIERRNRAKLLSSARFDIKSTRKLEADGSITMTFQFGPDLSLHPGNSDYLNRHLEDAEKLGFQIMPSPRFGKITNSDIKDSLYVLPDPSSFNQWMATFANIANELEERGLGMARAKAIGEKYMTSGQVWYEGLGNAPASEQSIIAKAVAEWADGDSVAVHVAFENHLFCTLDQGKSAGGVSVLSPENKLWLGSKYQVKFVTPQELCELIG